MSARFVTEGDGYTTWHCFSSGAHYDPDRISWGPVVALDEHLVEPGGGFDWHPHRGVWIASWVLEGALRHEDSNGALRVAEPGAFLVQSTGRGLRHRETNASDTEPLRMIQVVVLGESPYAVREAPPPTTFGGVRVDVVSGEIRPGDAAVFVVRGRYASDDARLVAPGAFVTGTAVLTPLGDAGELLMITALVESDDVAVL